MKTQIKSLRRQDEKLPPDYDLTSSVGGESIDIMLNYKGTWTLRYFGYAKPFATRTAAIDWIEQRGLSSMQDELKEN